MRHPVIIGVLSTILLFGFAHVAPSQPSTPTSSPRDLAGEWEGQWQTSTASGALYVTIKKIEGAQVSGIIYIKGDARYHNRDLLLTGTLGGTTLAGSFPTMPGNPPITYEWEIGQDGKSMSGWAQGLARSSVSLTKKK